MENKKYLEDIEYTDEDKKIISSTKDTTENILRQLRHTNEPCRVISLDLYRDSGKIAVWTKLNKDNK